ncbi:hypothetical protein QYM36_016058 [Artemia franciscana]|uniref:Ankyrin repeat protein n=1 Tax=Artemia franciscana TaxID=6661 RepID=A0AA88KTC9_ARTSF|nr:hypothetical protein QYM36_016058 [Artemia franciscana]
MIKFEDNIGELPKLHKSSFIGELEDLNAIKEINAKLEMVCSNKATPLIYAVHNKSALEVVGYLLGKGANPSYRSYGPFENNFQKFVSGQTPLHHAVWKGRDDVCKLLIDSGAELDATNVYGETPLVTAIKANNLNLVNFLLDRGADPNYGECLHLAAKKGGADMCKLLIDFGAKLDAMNAENDAPLHIAIRYKNSNLVKFLLDKGAKPNCDKHLSCGDIKTGFYLCPLLSAIYNHNFVIVKCLVERGVTTCSSQFLSGQCYSGLFRDEFMDEDHLWEILVGKDDAEAAFR